MLCLAHAAQDNVGNELFLLQDWLFIHRWVEAKWRESLRRLRQAMEDHG